jgi:predicted polyphosphate/ATP-dependent NAD kinase
MMGEDIAQEIGFETEVVSKLSSNTTSAADTIMAATRMLQLNLDLILFAGGDGTARDLVRAVDTKIPVVGIPAGVKMHSAVYATNPYSAGNTVLRFARGGTKFQELEVMDIDEAAYREGALSAKLYGFLNTPYFPDLFQGIKASGVSENLRALSGIATRSIEEMSKDKIYILGPGTTTREISHKLGIHKTLLGVDIVQNYKHILSDASENDIWSAVQNSCAEIIVTPIGGQGHFLGRGNQQISAKVVEHVGVDNISVIATPEKISSLYDNTLHVDTGNQHIDSDLCGWRKVVTGFNTTSICRVRR